MQRTNLVFWHKTPLARVPSVVDSVVIDEAGVQRGLVSGETQAELSDRYPDMQVIDIDDFIIMHNDVHRTPPEESSEERFTFALECMPPLDWQIVRGIESFKMEERLSANMTSIYARKEDRYWTFVDRDDLSAEEIASKIEAIL